MGGQFINGGNGKFANATMVAGSGIIRARNGRGAKGIRTGEEIRMPYGKAHWEADARIRRARRERWARQALTDLQTSVAVQDGGVRLWITIAPTVTQNTSRTTQRSEEDGNEQRGEGHTRHDTTGEKGVDTQTHQPDDEILSGWGSDVSGSGHGRNAGAS